MKSKWLTSLTKVLSLGAAFLLAGCDDMVLMNSKGPVGQGEWSLIVTAFILMLIVVVPVIIMTVLFAWRYRASNTKATYTPMWSHSNALEATVWSIPLVIIAILGVITWKSSHEFDPYRPLDSDKQPLTVQVVSLDWKWLFIYPKQGIASVNELVIPPGTPVKFEITSGTVMNSFFIPQLGGQIYAMAGMSTQLHLQADHPGTYDGISANYSGAGFSGMKFKAIATANDQDFEAWVAKVKSGSKELTYPGYKAIALKQDHMPVEYFSSVEPQIYHQIVMSFDQVVEHKIEYNHEIGEKMGAGAEE
ncbi:ubiquinol oxidase subunit II [Gallaecimonas pentaromativorans]|uniref:Ubiquinol oxidase subunit 2 n=1 Tax=Gallaecimonas pentaromativorans TaxID=584787 RepID=A0A3N1PI46_9GAMM|nr:ubiquinol oxidase subunit II [Gallaecimonas pentaromativorans]MED5525462.1 ubiquinol oxidase subunit II [Pseudomonadota bacterium]ROQ27488.1 cytochrome bo3 quinol oxidase subunit 2 [Gallaecimonas pentaromativorans]